MPHRVLLESLWSWADQSCYCGLRRPWSWLGFRLFFSLGDLRPVPFLSRALDRPGELAHGKGSLLALPLSPRRPTPSYS